MNVRINSKKVVEEVRDALSQLNSLDGNSIDAIAVLLSMDDAQFELVSPGILDSFLRSLNTTNARLMLAPVYQCHWLYSRKRPGRILQW